MSHSWTVQMIWTHLTESHSSWYWTFLTSWKLDDNLIFWPWFCNLCLLCFNQTQLKVLKSRNLCVAIINPPSLSLRPTLPSLPHPSSNTEVGRVRVCCCYSVAAVLSINYKWCQPINKVHTHNNLHHGAPPVCPQTRIYLLWLGSTKKR